MSVSFEYNLFFLLDDAWTLPTATGFDDDSINVEIITKSSNDALGKFTVGFSVFDGISKVAKFKTAINSFNVDLMNGIGENQIMPEIDVS